MMTNKMTLDDFRQIDERFQKEKPNLFRLSSPDTLAAHDDLILVESQLGIKLPPSYRAFLEAYGGGNFGLVTVFSADRSGEWYLPDKRREAMSHLPNELLPISDDFSGGYYVLKVEGGIAKEPVYYWNEDGGLVDTEFENVLAFVARYAYEPA